MAFFAIRVHFQETCESVWPPNASLYASSTCAHLQLLAGPFDQGFTVCKEYPQKFQIWKSETSPNQGTWLGIPWLGLVSLCQIWDFYWYSLNTLK